MDSSCSLHGLVRASQHLLYLYTGKFLFRKLQIFCFSGRWLILTSGFCAYELWYYTYRMICTSRIFYSCFFKIYFACFGVCIFGELFVIRNWSRVCPSIQASQPTPSGRHVFEKRSDSLISDFWLLVIDYLLILVLGFEFWLQCTFGDPK